MSSLQAETGRPKQRAKRQATMNAIIDAFERLLVNSGVSGLGVNALVKEAGVGKKQIYEYFGGLSGVAEAWVKERGVWPSLEEMLGEEMDVFSQRAPADKLRMVNVGYANLLRNNAALAELMSGEFSKNKEVYDAIEHIRQLIRKDFERVLVSDTQLTHPDYLAISTVTYAAASYLGLRRHHHERFFGFDLSEETSWQAVLNMFNRLIALSDPGQIDEKEQPDNFPLSKVD